MCVRQRIVAAALLLALGGAAYAQSQPLFHDIYLGAGGGASKALGPADCSPPPGFTTTACSSDDRKSGWKVFVGLDVNPYVAFEAAYADLGKFGTTKNWVFVATPMETSVSAHPTVYGVDVVGTLPIGGGLGLLGRVGFFRWTLDASQTVTPFPVFGVAEPARKTSAGYNFDFGLGAKWDFTRNLGARIEYQRYPKIGDDEFGKSDVDLFSASLLYRFDTAALGGSAYVPSAFHGIYIGAGGGVAKASLPDCSLPFNTTNDCDIQDKKTAWRAFLGFQVNPYLAFEVGYADLNKFTTSFTVPTGGPGTVVVASFRPTLYGVDAVGILPIGGGFGLLGRIGYFHWKLQASTTVSPPSLPGIVDPGGDTPTGYNVDLGVGAKWDFAQNLGARLEYTRFPKIGNAETTGKSDIDLLSASLLYRF